MTFYPERCRQAFTRTELLFTIGAVLLVLAILFAVTQWQAHQKLSQCKGNLKNLALAWHLWLEDHDTVRPPWRTLVNEKGTLGFEPAALRSEFWFQMMAFSNHLISPKFLADPADRGTRIATTWDENPAAGFAAPQFQNHASSYTLSLDYAYPYPDSIWPDTGRGVVLFTDRHLDGNTATEHCSEGVTATAFKQPFSVRWSSDIHGRKVGNVALVDGSVHSSAAESIKDILPRDFRTPGQSAHFLFPRRTPKNH